MSQIKEELDKRKLTTKTKYMRSPRSQLVASTDCESRKVLISIHLFG